MRPGEPIRPLLRRRVTRSQLHRQSVVRKLCAFGFCQQAHERQLMPINSGSLRTWHSCALAWIDTLHADDEPVCQLRGPGALASALRREPQRSHLVAVAQERALRFVGVAVADVHPVGGLQRVRARLNNLAVFLRHSCSGALEIQGVPALTHLELAKHSLELLRLKTKHRHPRFSCIRRRGPLRAVLRHRVRRRQARKPAWPDAAHPKQAGGRRKDSWHSLRRGSCGAAGQHRARVAWQHTQELAHLRLADPPARQGPVRTRSAAPALHAAVLQGTTPTAAARTANNALATGSGGHSVGEGAALYRAAVPSERGVCSGCKKRLAGVTGVPAPPHDGCRCAKPPSPPRAGFGEHRRDAGGSRGVPAIATSSDTDAEGEDCAVVYRSTGAWRVRGARTGAAHGAGFVPHATAAPGVVRSLCQACFAAAKVWLLMPSSRAAGQPGDAS